MNQEENKGVAGGTRGPHLVLMVDDEPQACKWFARLYGGEFAVLTASGVDEALALLAERGPEIAVLLTDYSMPGRDGVALLGEVRRLYPHVARLLMSAYADKDVAMSAINQGQVEKMLEKPLEDALTRQVLRESMAVCKERVRQQQLVERRASALRDTLGFLAHEVTSPLATVRGYLSAMRDRYRDAHDGQDGVAHIEQEKPGDVLFMIDAAQRRATYAQSLVSTFVQSARDASRGDTSASLLASDLVRAVKEDYPFEPGEADCLSIDTSADFVLPGRRDLLFLVLCTLVKNAFIAMRATPPLQPVLRIELTRAAPEPGLPLQATLVVSDNGPGIAPEVLARLMVEPVTTRAESGGSGMGMLFCHRVITSLGGSIGVHSNPGQGTTVSLHFPSAQETPVEETR